MKFPASLRRFRTLTFILAALLLLVVLKLILMSIVEAEFAREIAKPDTIAHREALYERFLALAGPVRAQAVLASTLPDDGVGHIISHEAGTYLYIHEGPHGISKCASYFADGCFHGFIAAMARDVGLAGIPAVSQSCRSAVSLDSVNRCSHGIGHALLDLIGVTKMPEAISLCAQVFATDTKATNFCADGVFMEAKFNGDASLTYDPKDPMYPCNESWIVAAGVHDRCWIAQSQRTLQPMYAGLFDSDVAKVAAYCKQFAGRDRVNCNWGIELQIVFMVHGATAVEAQCAKMGSGTDEDGYPLSNSCVWRVEQAAYQFGDHDTLPRICSAETSSRLQDGCYRSLDYAIANSFSNDTDRIEACRALPSARAQACVDWMHSPAAAAY